MASSRHREFEPQLGAATTSEQRMSTTIPSPVDRGEFRFVALDSEGHEWHWADEEMVWMLAGDGTTVICRSGPTPETH